MIARAIKLCIPPRILLLSLGVLCLALGIIGAFVPVMPSMVFLVAALWAFSKGSERFHTWLYEHRHFGPSLRDWCEHRVISPRSKLLGLGGMCASSAIVLAMFPLGSAVPLVYCGLNLIGALFILSRPSRPAVAIPVTSGDDGRPPITR